MDLPIYSEITPGLWMGGTDDYDTVDRPGELPRLSSPLDFDAVITLNAYAKPFGWYVRELRFGFPDAPLDGEHASHIEEVADWGHRAWKRGERLLVRCQAGMNRSGLVTALVLKREGITHDAAINLIRKKRHPDALSNESYLQYLSRVK